MANICSTELRIFWDSPIDTDEIDEKYFLDIEKVFDKYFQYYEVADSDAGYMNIFFDSKWDFPEQLMEDVVKELPQDVTIACLSTEWGNYYCAFHTWSKEEGWVYRG